MSASSACRAAWPTTTIPTRRIAPAGLSVIAVGASAALILVVSGVLFFAVLIRGHRAPRAEPGATASASAVHEPRAVPAALNGFGLWLALMIGLTVDQLRLSDRAAAGAARTPPCPPSTSEPRDERASAVSPRAIRWFTASVGVTARLVVLPRVGGFVVLPYAADRRSSLPASGTRSAAPPACRAHPRRRRAGQVRTFKTSDVVDDTRRCCGAPTRVSIGRGATLAHAMRDLPRPGGVSRANSPNLAGQYATAIYKELHDFKTGARVNAVMSPVRGQL